MPNSASSQTLRANHTPKTVSGTLAMKYATARQAARSPKDARSHPNNPGRALNGSGSEISSPSIPRASARCQPPSPRAARKPPARINTPTRTTVSASPAIPSAARASAPAHARAELARKNPSSAQLRFWKGSRPISRARRLACSARSCGIRICTRLPSAPAWLKRLAG